MATQFTPEELARLRAKGLSESVLNILSTGQEAPRYKGDLNPELMDAATAGGYKPTLDSTTVGENLGIAGKNFITASKSIGNNFVGALDTSLGINNRGLIDAATENQRLQEESFKSLNPNQANALASPAEFGKNYLAKGSAMAGSAVPAIGAITAGGMLGGTVGAAAAGAAVMGVESASPIAKEKYDLAKSQGMSDEQALQAANEAGLKGGLGNAAIGAIQGATPMLAGAHLAGRLVNAVAPESAIAARGLGALTGGAADAGVNAVISGPAAEAIRASAVGNAYDSERAKDGAIQGAIMGGALGAGFGQGAGRHALTPLEFTRHNYSNHQIESGLLSEEGAKRRAEYLSKRDNTPYEVLPSINAEDGTVGSKFVVGKRTGEATEATPDSILEQTKAEQLAKQNNPEVTPTEEVSKPKAVEEPINSDDIINQYHEQAKIQEENNNPLSAVAEIVKGQEEVSNIKPVEQDTSAPLESVVKPNTEEVSKPLATESQLNTNEPSLKEINAHNSKHYYGSGKNGNFEVKFNNDLDRAVYVASQAAKLGETLGASKSAKHENFINFIQKHTDLSSEDIYKIGFKMRDEISGNIKSKTNIQESNGKKSVVLDSNFVRDFINSRPKAEELSTKTVDAESRIVQGNKLPENNIPEFKPKFEKRNYGLDTDSKVIKDESGNIQGMSFKATVARPNEFGSQSGGKDHTGIDIHTLDDIFKSGYKNLTLEREPKNPVDTRAIRIMADGKLLGYIPNRRDSGYMADKLSSYMDNGNFKSIHAELHAEAAPYSKKTSEANDSFVFKKDDAGREAAYRPIIEVKTSFGETNAKDLAQNISSKEKVLAEPKQSKNDNFIDEMASNYIGRDISKMTNEEVSAVFKDKVEAQKFATETFAKVKDELHKEFENFGSDFDFYVRHGEDLYDVTGTRKNFEQIKEYIENPESSGTAGFFAYDPETSKGVAVVDLVRIHEQVSDPKSPLSSIGNVQDAAKFVLFHESLGHGGFNKFFKSVEQKNEYLNKVYEESQIIRDIAEVKKKAGYDANNIPELVEEALSDIAGGRVQINENGKSVYKPIDEFLNQYKDNPSLALELLNSIKQLVNKVFGKEIFKVTNEKLEFEQVVAQMKEISEAVNQSPYIKAKNNFYADEFIPKHMKDMTIKMARNSNSAYDPDLMYSKAEMRKVFIDSLLAGMNEKVRRSFIKSPDYMAAKDPVYAKGHKMIQEKDSASTRYENQMTTEARKLKPLSKQSSPLYKKILSEQATKGKVFTADELRAKNIPSDVITAYETMNRARATNINLTTRSRMVKEAYDRNLITDAEHLDLSRIENYTTDELAKSIADLANKNSPNTAARDMQTIYNLRDQGLNDIRTGHIARVATGDYHIAVYDKSTGEIKDFKQYTSQFERNIELKLIEKRYGDTVRVEKGVAPKDPKKLADYESKFNQLLVESEKAGIPFDVAKALEKSFQVNSKQIGKNLWSNNINRYTKLLEKEGNTVTANNLDALNANVDKPDPASISKIKQITSILALGGNIASGIANYIGIGMNLTPWLQMHGGAKNVAGAITLAHKYINIGKLSQAEFVAKMSKESYFNGFDNAEVTKALNEMYNSNLLFEQHSANLDRLVNGNQVKDAGSLALKAYMSIQAKSEQVAKVTSILSGLKTGLENGKTSHDLHDFTKQAVFQTQGYYGKAGRPLWANGAIGQMLYQFKKFPQTTVELMFQLGAYKSGDKFNIKDKIPAATMGLLLLGAVGGGGMPFVSNVSDIYDTIGKAMGYKSTDIRESTRKAIRDFLGEEHGNLVMNGLLSDYAIPADFASKLSMDSLLPMTDLLDETNKDKTKSIATLLGASGNNLIKWSKGLDDIFKGDTRAALFDGAPGVVKNAVIGTQAFNSGEFRDAKNQKITTADKWDAVLKGIGIAPRNLSETTRLQEEFNTKKLNLENAKNIVYGQMVRAKLFSDSSESEGAKQNIQEWNDANPTQKLKLNLTEVNQMVRKAKQDFYARSGKAINKELRPEYKETANKLKNN